MKLTIVPLAKALVTKSNAYYRQSVKREDIETFKKGLGRLFFRLDEKESEEHLKNIIADFLKEVYKHDSYEINTRERKDLVIHNGKSSKDPVAVLIEAKRPGNGAEMISGAKPNAKALQELIHYFMDERLVKGNIELKYLVITNIYEWYIFDAADFEKIFYENKEFKKSYESWHKGSQVSTNTDHFYKEVAKPFIEKVDEINCIHFSLKAFESIIRGTSKEDNDALIDLYKIISPQFLLKQPYANDSNKLNKDFYNELLHIIGLEEIKANGKKIIDRKNEEKRDDGSLLENIFQVLRTEDALSKVEDVSKYGETEEEQYFGIALELCITWLNRILFLKLLEGQLVRYHKGKKEYAFLNSQSISDFDELNELFFEVLAVKTSSRSKSVAKKFGAIPYLNSSLFDRTELEERTIKVSNLKDRLEIEVYSGTVLKIESSGKKVTGTKPTLQYLFEFLDAFDFASEGTARVQEQTKDLINASVLGLIFEKINGYKEGSFYTPGFITMYMCREAIRQATVQKFNVHYKWKCKDFDALIDKVNYDDANTRAEANALMNTLHICDPAVGSGHFLVSALNEIISVKNDLGILSFRDGKRIRGYKLSIDQDELSILDEDKDKLFEYTLNDNHKPVAETQKLQMALFHEKQTIIENCIFGVDINPNSVKICRLRLWIELLKNAYYTAETDYKELETLPNIDINIKEGNSLVYRFPLQEDLTEIFKKQKIDFQKYKDEVAAYKETHTKDAKERLRHSINNTKLLFKEELIGLDPLNKKVSKLRGDIVLLENPDMFGEQGSKEVIQKKQKELDGLVKEKDERENNVLYRNAFEWRFEFPEVLDANANFIGFDVTIGNPPYIQLQKMGKEADILQKLNYETFVRTGDIYCLFYELGFRILKKEGLLAYITSNKWMRAAYGQTIRKFFLDKSSPLILIDFAGAQVFESATVDTNILIAKSTKNENKIQTCVVKDLDGLTNMSDYFRQNSIAVKGFNPESGWVIMSSVEARIKAKIEEMGVPLKDWDVQINRGILTGFNEAFIIDQDTRDKLVSASPKNAEIIRPILRGRDVSRYHINYSNLWLINSHNGVKENGLSRIDVEKDYPSIYEHLKQYKKNLENRSDKGDHWTNLRNCAYLDLFIQPKIIYPETMRFHNEDTFDFPRFTYDEGIYICDKTTFIITSKADLHYLLAFLNSIIMRFLIPLYVSAWDQGGFMLQKIFLEHIPIPEIKNNKDIISLSKKIIKTSSNESFVDDIEAINKIFLDEIGFSEEEKLYLLNLK